MPNDVSITSSIPFGVKSSNKATITISPVVTTTSVKLIDVNKDRLGLILYNNSSNSIYIALGSAANSNTNMTFIIPTFASLTLPAPVYTGVVHGIRNAGTGTVLCTELT